MLHTVEKVGNNNNKKKNDDILNNHALNHANPPFPIDHAIFYEFGDACNGRSYDMNTVRQMVGPVFYFSYFF